jgi:hypothetical protein
MKTTIHPIRRIHGFLSCLALGAMLALSVQTSSASITLYYDDFQSYPIQNPAPNPLTNGPAGGQWFYVDPVPPLTAGEHQILEHLGDVTTTGAGLYSRVWASATDNARLTNAISVSALPAGPAPYTFRLSFVVACDTLTTTRNITFNYAISSSAGSLGFVSGHNLDNNQTFAGLSGTGIATAGTTGKSNDRRFEFVFQSSTITTADKIDFAITRVTNNAGAVLNIFLDDVRLGVDDANGPVVQSVQPVLTLQHVRVNFSEPVDPTSATNLANYSFTAGPLSVQGATLLAPSVVELFTSDQAPSSTHTLQISGVLGQSGISMTSTQLNFTAPALTISPVRYDAGTTVTQPSGPPSPASADGGYWVEAGSFVSGISVGPVANDNGTGLNAWNNTDSITTSGFATDSMPIAQNSVNLPQTNGWRIVVRDRFVDAFGTTATGADQYILYYTPGNRYGLSWTLDATTNLSIFLAGGSSYVVASQPDAYSYHTSMMVYNPATKAASVYFDGRLIFDNYTGQVLAGNGVNFGSASSSGKASVNYNLVQLDVVGATQPVVLQNPASITKNIGEQATFTAAFTPFVNSYQWLSNGVVIAGATATNYTTGFIDSSYNGVQYRCRALSALGNVETAAATLTVTDNGPWVQSVLSVLTLQHVRVAFSAAVDPASATNLVNYSFSAGALTLQMATLISPSVVEFLTSDQTPSSTHTLQISGVLANGGSTSMTTTQLSFTTPALTISPLRYDAGTTTTQPTGPLDPADPAAGYWAKNLPVVAGFSVAAVLDDNATGLNAWNITDSTTATGTPNYSMAVGQAASMNLALSNGWRIVTRNRLVSNYGTTTADQYLLYYNPGVRYGLSWGMDVNGNLWLNPLGGSTYTVTSDALSYHTNMMVYNPATKAVSVYFDGRLIVDNYAGQALAGNGLTFGSASSAGKGSMNYNLVQLDVVGATRPVVLQNPASTTNGVGQKVTFVANFSPFVNAFQWLSNGVVIAGATATNYTTGFIDSSYNGVQYTCRALSALGNVDTAAAVLTVTTDVTPPFIVAAKASLLGDRISITYSEPVMELYATNIANYTWVNAGVTNISAQLMDPVTVELRAGPFVRGGNYAVLVSNVRDVSNLIITPNSPASVIIPSLSPLARYDAGDTTTAPSGPPDPTSPTGGNWSVTSWSDPNLTVTAVTDDSGTGLNAWQVRDASSLYNYANYTQQLATNVQDNARAYGWMLTVRGRMPENFGSSVDQFALFSDYNANRFVLGFNLDANNNLVVGANPGNYTVTSNGSGMNYHLHQMVYDPASATASYYFDGTLIARGFSANIVANPSVLWGSASGLGQGTMNYNLVDFSTVYGPLLSIVRNGPNIDVSYRGILQTATNLGNPTVWTSVATNSSSGTSVYSIPVSSQSCEFFRARMLQ